MSGPGTLMAAEMGEQPDVIRRLVASADAIRGGLEPVLPEPLAGTVLVARGSSDAAAVYGRYVLELATRRPVALAAPSLLTRYGAEPDTSGWLAVAVSQSGQTPEIVDTLAALRRGGALGVALTNDRSSPLAGTADLTVALQAGDEFAVPATKTFTAQVAAFALLAQALGDVPWQPEDWDAAISSVVDVLADPAPAEQAAHRLQDATKMLTVARGLTYAVALEGALKLAETTGLPTTGYSAADLLHGPIAAAGPDLRAVAFAAAGPCLDDVAGTVDELLRRNTPVTVVASEDAARRFDDRAVLVPVADAVPEPLSPLPLVVRAQQIAHALALTRGIDPDEPHGLSKITATD